MLSSVTDDDTEDLPQLRDARDADDHAPVRERHVIGALGDEIAERENVRYQESARRRRCRRPEPHLPRLCLVAALSRGVAGGISKSLELYFVASNRDKRAGIGESAGS